jgi:hypothetical protein
MKILASQITKELEKATHCAIYEPDLSRVWPDDGRQREPQIASFAKSHGGFATTRTDSAQFSIKPRLTKEASSSVQKRRQLSSARNEMLSFARCESIAETQPQLEPARR